MTPDLVQTLAETVARHGPALRAISEEATSGTERAAAWSRKQELGHLIDSAANNQNRLVRAALDGEFRGPGYDQNGWVRLNGYAGMPWLDVVDFWEAYNRLLGGVIARIPEERSGALCVIGTNPPLALRSLVEDYLAHMRHHLGHILRA